jgi:hypothetical protein
MKSFLLTTTALAGLASAQQNGDHLSGGEAHNIDRHQEECDNNIVVNCQVEEGWAWSACDSTCGQGHATRSRAVTVEAWYCMAPQQTKTNQHTNQHGETVKQRRHRVPAADADQDLHGASVRV